MAKIQSMAKRQKLPWCYGKFKEVKMILQFISIGVIIVLSGVIIILFPRRSKINIIVKKARKKERKIQEQLRKKSERKLKRSCKNRIDTVEKKCYDEIKLLKAQHYRKIYEKNQQIKAVGDKWFFIKDKSVEFANMAEQFESWALLKKLNAADEYKFSAKIKQVSEKITRFVYNNEVEIEKALGGDG